MDYRLLIFCVFALPAPFFLFQEWRIQGGYSRNQRKRKSCLVMIVATILETVSVGALMTLIGYGLGRMFSFAFSSYRSFGGIVSIPVGFGVWFGICGLVVGLGLALKRTADELESE